MRGYNCIQLQTIHRGFVGLHLDRGVFRLGGRLFERQGWISVVAY